MLPGNVGWDIGWKGRMVPAGEAGWCCHLGRRDDASWHCGVGWDGMAPAGKVG